MQPAAASPVRGGYGEPPWTTLPSRRPPSPVSPPTARGRPGWAARGAAGYLEMTNLRGPVHDELATTVPYSTLTLAEEARSRDGTVSAFRRPTAIRSRPS